MHLRLEQLRKIAKTTMSEEKAVIALREETKRVLGSVIDTNVKLEDLARAINDRMEVLAKTGRANRVTFRSSVIAKFVDNKNPEVRRMAAHFLPEKYLNRYLFDKDPGVKAVVMSRASKQLVNELLQKNPHDDQLRTIYRTRLNELKSAPQDDVTLGVLDPELLDDVVKDNDQFLSDVWYKTKAIELIRPCTRRTIEGDWEEKTVDAFVKHTKATSGVVIDRDKLLKAVEDAIKDEEDIACKKNELKEIVQQIKKGAIFERTMKHTPFIPIIAENDVDPVSQLLAKNYSSNEYVKRVYEIFRIKDTFLSRDIKEHCDKLLSTKAPKIGYVPGLGSITPQVETALDRFVESWNAIQRLRNEPLAIEWYPHPNNLSEVYFNVYVR